MGDEKGEEFSINREIYNSVHRIDMFKQMFYNRPNYKNARRVIKECRYHKKLVNKKMKAMRDYIWGGYSAEEVKEELSKENQGLKKGLERKIR